MLRGASSRGHMRGGGCVVVRRGHLIALVVAFLIGCVAVLTVGASGVQAEASKKEEARCQGTRKINVNLPARFTSNDLPGCPQGGLLLGTDKPDLLAGEKGDDEVRSLGGKDDVMGGPGNDVIYGGADNDGLYGDGREEEEGNDIIYGGPGDDDVNVFRIGDDGNDVIYGGPGDDNLRGFDGEDVIYGGPGDDKLDGGPSDAVFVGEVLRGGGDGQRDKLYCGEGRDSYFADKEDYVDSSCEVKLSNSLRFPKEPTGPRPIGVGGGGPASGSPVPVPSSGGAAILLPAAALLLGSGILTYAILRRR